MCYFPKRLCSEQVIQPHFCTMPSYPPFLLPWKEISRPQLASAFPSVRRSLRISRYRCTYISVSEYPNLKPLFPSLPSLFLPDMWACFSLMQEEARGSLQFQNTNKSLKNFLWISLPIFSIPLRWRTLNCVTVLFQNPAGKGCVYEGGEEV